MAPLAVAADLSTGAVRMVTLPTPPHTVSLPTPASADLPHRLRAPGQQSGGNNDVYLVLLIDAPSSMRPIGNEPLQSIIPTLAH
jgi:hypothetical protein